MTLDTSERHPICLVLNFAHGESEEGTLDDKPVLWKDLMAEGMVARTPGLKEKIPFRVIPTGRSSSRDGNITVSMSDLQEAFEAKAFQDVTIPDGHPKPDRILPDGRVVKGDSALNNTGYVRGLRVVKKRVKKPDGNGPEIHVLQAALGFTEPDVAAKVKRGTVPNVSAGVFFDFVRKHDDRYFRAALNHAALTKQPWMQDLEPFERAYFSADDNEYEFQQVLLADDKPDDENDAKVIWKEQFGANTVRNQISNFLNPPVQEEGAPGVPERPRAFYYVEDVTHNEPNLAQVEENYRGKSTRWVVPYTQDNDGGVTVSPQAHWVEGTMAMIAASDEDESFAGFEHNTIDHLKDRLVVALDDMFGDSHKLIIDKVSTDGRALLRNSDTGAEHVARFREVGNHAYFADTAEWTTVKLPQSKSAPTPAAAPANVVTLDTSTPEGRVAAARQRRAALLATSN
jgi:hypothetical protein